MQYYYRHKNLTLDASCHSKKDMKIIPSALIDEESLIFAIHNNYINEYDKVKAIKDGDVIELNIAGENGTHKYDNVPVVVKDVKVKTEGEFRKIAFRVDDVSMELYLADLKPI